MKQKALTVKAENYQRPLELLVGLGRPRRLRPEVLVGISQQRPLMFFDFPVGVPFCGKLDAAAGWGVRGMGEHLW